MKYLEKNKEKKYRPLFGYGYEPKTATGNKEAYETGQKFDAFGNVIYDLPIEAEVEPDEDEDANTASKKKLSGFKKPDENPLPALIVAVFIALSLFMIAVIMSLTGDSESARNAGQGRFEMCSDETAPYGYGEFLSL